MASKNKKNLPQTISRSGECVKEIRLLCYGGRRADAVTSSMQILRNDDLSSFSHSDLFAISYPVEIEVYNFGIGREKMNSLAAYDGSLAPGHNSHFNFKNMDCKNRNHLLNIISHLVTSIQTRIINEEHESVMRMLEECPCIAGVSQSHSKIDIKLIRLTAAYAELSLLQMQAERFLGDFSPWSNEWRNSVNCTWNFLNTISDQVNHLSCPIDSENEDSSCEFCVIANLKSPAINGEEQFENGIKSPRVSNFSAAEPIKGESQRDSLRNKLEAGLYAVKMKFLRDIIVNTIIFQQSQKVSNDAENLLPVELVDIREIKKLAQETADSAVVALETNRMTIGGKAEISVPIIRRNLRSKKFPQLVAKIPHIDFQEHDVNAVQEQRRLEDPACLRTLDALYSAADAENSDAFSTSRSELNDLLAFYEVRAVLTSEGWTAFQKYILPLDSKEPSVFQSLSDVIDREREDEQDLAIHALETYLRASALIGLL